MGDEQRIKVGQIWRRKSNGRHIRIVAERLPWGGYHIDDWAWEGHDYKGHGVSYGEYIRRGCDLVSDETPGGAA